MASKRQLSGYEFWGSLTENSTRVDAITLQSEQAVETCDIAEWLLSRASCDSACSCTGLRIGMTFRRFSNIDVLYS